MIEAKPISFGIFGPASPVVDNQIAAFDGTTGRKIQSRAVTIDDNGNMIMPDNAWIGLGAAKGRIEFDDQATDEINFLDCNVGIGSSPSSKLTIGGAGLQSITRSVNDAGLLIIGGTRYQDGAYFQITGEDNTGSPGLGSAEFVIRDSDFGDDLSKSKFGIFSYDGSSTWLSRFAIYGYSGNIRMGHTGGNVGIGGATTFGINAAGTFAMGNGTAPTTNVADQHAYYSADFAAGNAAPYFRTENGTVIGLNQSLLTTDNVTHNRLALTGGFKANLVTKTGAYTATADDYTILCNASGGSFTITLPAVASHTNRIYNIKKIDSSANAVTVDGNNSETIDDGTTAILTTQYESITIQSDGSEWWIL